jgi:acetyl esterase
MSLDPQVEELLREIAELGYPALEDCTPQEARKLLASRIDGFSETGDIAISRDGVVPAEELPGDLQAIPYRVYRPSDEPVLPALVYFHGGGWVIGDLDTHEGICRALANSAGCAVFSVDYRLAPEHKYPAAADDCYAFTRWLAENSEAQGVDPGKIAVGGDSAGGNLAAVVALMARDSGSPSLCCQLLIYPVTDYSYETESYLENAEGYGLTLAGMTWFWNHYLARESDGGESRASPIQAETLEGLPPAYVITAGFDPLRDEGDAYAARLIEAGVPVELDRYEGMIHGFCVYLGRLDQAGISVDRMSAALRRSFGQEE